jgi:hypothetical protein
MAGRFCHSTDAKNVRPDNSMLRVTRDYFLLLKSPHHIWPVLIIKTLVSG